MTSPRVPAHRRAPRRAGVTGALLGLALVLAGCGAEDRSPAPDAAADQSSESLLPPAEGETSYPLTLTSPWGETVLDERPERIAAVVADGTDTELLAALGVTPVVAPDTVDRAIWTLDALPAEIETVYAFDPDKPFPLEKIAGAKPDLIIAIGGWDLSKEYDDLARVAPVLTGETKAEFEAGWQEKLGIIGETIDLSGAAEQVISDHDAHFEQVRADHPEFEGRTATFAIYYGPEYGLTYYSGKGSDPQLFLESLGFAPNPIAAEFGKDEGVVSAENLGKLDADVLVLSDNSEGSIADITGQRLFKQLPAVEEGRLALLTLTDEGFEYDGTEAEGNLAWALAGSGPLGERWAADQLVPILSGLLEPTD